MNLPKFVFKSHKWLAVATGILSFFWFFSGIVMTLPLEWFRSSAQTIAGPQNAPGAQQDPYRGVKISIPEAAAAADRAVGSPVVVTDIATRFIEGQFYYRVATQKNGAVLINGTDGSELRINDDVARRILEFHGIPSETLGVPTTVTRFNAEYTYGPLPVIRFAAADPRKMIYYVEVEGGAWRSVSRVSRIKDYIIGLHSLTFLNSYVSVSGIRLIMWVFSVLGTVMTVFGFWILWLQWKNWLHARRRA